MQVCIGIKEAIEIVKNNDKINWGCYIKLVILLNLQHEYDINMILRQKTKG